jgi:FLVCR family MFS transporter 7
MQQEDPYSYTIAILFMLTNGLTAAMTITLSPLSNILKEYYSATNFEIFCINSTHAFYFIIFNFIANYVIDEFGARRSLQICLILQVLGCYLRTITTDDVFYMVVGQSLIAMGNPFVTNSLSKVSNQWFTSQKRVKLTSIMSSSYMFGLSFGFLLTSLVWSVEVLEDAQSIKNKIDTLLFLNSLLCFLIALPVFLFFKEKPENSPSPSASAKRESFISGLFILKNRNYFLLFLAFSIALANFFSIVSMIYIVLAPFGFDETQCSIIGLIINIFAGLSKIFVGYIAGKYMSIKNIIMLNFAFKIFAVIIFLMCLGPGNAIYFASAFLGFFIQMYWGPAFEYSCELVFPVSESHANGFLVLGGLVGGLFSNYMVDSLFTYHLNPNIFFIYVIFTYILGIVFIYMIDDKNHREEYEKSELQKFGMSSLL